MCLLENIAKLKRFRVYILVQKENLKMTLTSWKMQCFNLCWRLQLHEQKKLLYTNLSNIFMSCLNNLFVLYADLNFYLQAELCLHTAVQTSFTVAGVSFLQWPFWHLSHPMFVSLLTSISRTSLDHLHLTSRPAARPSITWNITPILTSLHFYLRHHYSPPQLSTVWWSCSLESLKGFINLFTWSIIDKGFLWLLEIHSNF